MLVKIEIENHNCEFVTSWHAASTFNQYLELRSMLKNIAILTSKNFMWQEQKYTLT